MNDAKLVFLDFETYYDDEYTLKKMTIEEYVRDPRFKIHGVGIADHAGEPAWFTNAEAFKRHDWSNAAICCHHAQFDGFILAHWFGVKPKLWLDTLSMARLIRPHDRHDLDALSVAHGLPGKPQGTLNSVKGCRDLTAQQSAELGAYCRHDVRVTRGLFYRFMKEFPRPELKVIDRTIRMFTEPHFVLDQPRARAELDRLEKSRLAALEVIGVKDGEPVGKAKLAAVLRNIGIEPPTKVSLKTGRTDYAFAKTDAGMQALQDHPDDRVQAAVAAYARLRSTLAQTRLTRLLGASERGPLPVYLKYAGAHTTRFSGGDNLNWQNFPRAGEIRKSIKAPPGHKLLIADKAQIECRLLNWFAGQHNIVQAFREGRDIYSELATKFFGRTITKSDKIERFVGKTMELGLGYGLGGTQLRIALAEGKTGPVVILTQDESDRAVTVYRDDHKAVRKSWKTAKDIMYRQLLPRSGIPLQWGPLTVVNNTIVLPDGCPLVYDLELDGNGELHFRTMRGKQRLYGGKLIENVIQALAAADLRGNMRNPAIRWHMALQVHDELVFVVPDIEIDEAKSTIEEVFTTPPHWAPDLPLAVEIVIGERYEK